MRGSGEAERRNRVPDSKCILIIKSFQWEILRDIIGRKMQQVPQASELRSINNKQQRNEMFCDHIWKYDSAVITLDPLEIIWKGGGEYQSEMSDSQGITEELYLGEQSLPPQDYIQLLFGLILGIECWDIIVDLKKQKISSARARTQIPHRVSQLCIARPW